MKLCDRSHAVIMREGIVDSCMSSLSPVSSQNSDDSNNDSDRVDEHMLQPRRSRKRAKTQHPTRKLQVSTLRAEAESLHAKLQSLQYKSARAESADAVSSRAQHAWRRVALSQLDQRRRAEDENISLREMAAVQVLEAKNLRRILRRRTRIEMMEDMLGVKERVRLLKQTSLNDPGIFQQLTQDASALYDRIDSLFAINNMDALPFTGHTREAYLDKVNGTYYEVRQKRLVPFSVQDTEKAVWQCLGSLGLTNRRAVGGPEVRFNSHPDSTKTEEDALQNTFSVVISGVGELVGTHNWKVVRRHKDDKRVVFLCRILTEPRFQSGHAGVRATSTTHIILETSDSGTTVVQMYFSAERDISSTLEDTTATLAIAAWDELVPQIVDDVETILLDWSKGSGDLVAV